MVDDHSLRMNIIKAQPIIEVPVPTNVKQFLGMIGWYSRFIEKSVELKPTLHQLLKKDVSWTESH